MSIDRRTTTALIAVALLALFAAALFVLFGTRGAPEPVSSSPGGSAIPPKAPSAPIAPGDEAASSNVVDPHETRAGALEPEPAADATPEAIAGESSDDPVGTVLYGLVRYEGAEPRPGREANVSIVGVRGDRSNVRVDADGRYSIAGLTDGRWWIEAGCLGFDSERDEIELEESDRILRRDFTLESSIRIRIKLAGPRGESLREMFEDPANAHLSRAFGDFVPVATREHPGETFTEVIGSHNNPFGVGQFWESGYVFGNLGPGYMGILLLREPPPVYVSLVNYHDIVETHLVEPGTEEVTFRISPEIVRSGGVALRVLDGRTSAPIDGAFANLSNSRSGSLFRPETDTEGRITIEDKAPGEYDLTIHRKGYATYKKRVAVVAGDVVELGDIYLEHERTLAGHTLDEQGDPVAVPIQLALLADSGMFTRASGGRSGADGAFQISALAPARYRVRVSEGDLVSPASIVDLQGGSVDGLTLRVKTGERLVFLPGQISFRALAYTIDNAEGVRVQSRPFYSDQPRTVRLPAGRYAVHIVDRKTREPLVERTVELGDGALVSVERP